MEEFSNANKLAAVLSTWARPAVSKIASDKLSSMSWIQSLQTGIVNLGLVHKDYNIAIDIEPLISPTINAMIEPILNEHLSKIPDDTIPLLAREIVGQMAKSDCISLLDGLVVLEKADVKELRRLIDLNLPMSNVKQYRVITNEQQ